MADENQPGVVRRNAKPLGIGGTLGAVLMYLVESGLIASLLRGLFG
jgi:hypothetical protein